MSPKNKARIFQKIALPLIDSLYAYAYSLTGLGDEAEDLVQETYLKAFKAFDSFKQGTNIKAWLFRILKNTFINEFHYKKRFEELDEEASTDEAFDRLVGAGRLLVQALETTAGLVEGDFADEVKNAMASLPEEFSSAVYMADVEEMSYEEISKVMEIPMGTVRSRIARGRKMLQIKLRRYAEKSGYIKRSEKNDGLQRD